MFFKKKSLPESNKQVEKEVPQSWVVRYYSCRGSTYAIEESEAEFFLSEKEANDFAESLRNAYALTKNTFCNKVVVKENE